MTIDKLLAHFCPATLAHLAAELLAGNAVEDDTGEFTFATEDAAQAFRLILDAGRSQVRAEAFDQLVDEAVAAELATER